MCNWKKYSVSLYLSGLKSVNNFETRVLIFIPHGKVEGTSSMAPFFTH